MRYKYIEAADLEIENPIYDLLIKEEDLIPAAIRTQEDIAHIQSRLNSLEENSPHREALEEEAGSVFDSEFESEMSLADIRHAINKLNGPNSVEPVRLLVGMMNAVSGVGLAGGVLFSTTPPGFIALGAANLLVAGNIGRMYAADSLKREQEARRLTDSYLEFADGVHKSREAFDELWARLIGDEDRDRLPEEE